MEGALDSEIVATVSKIAKLSSEAGGSGMKVVGDFHMSLLLLQKVTDIIMKIVSLSFWCKS